MDSNTYVLTRGGCSQYFDELSENEDIDYHLTGGEVIVTGVDTEVKTITLELNLTLDEVESDADIVTDAGTSYKIKYDGDFEWATFGI